MLASDIRIGLQRGAEVGQGGPDALVPKVIAHNPKLRLVPDDPVRVGDRDLDASSAPIFVPRLALDHAATVEVLLEDVADARRRPVLAPLRRLRSVLPVGFTTLSRWRLRDPLAPVPVARKAFNNLAAAKRRSTTWISHTTPVIGCDGALLSRRRPNDQHSLRIPEGTKPWNSGFLVGKAFTST